jgi:formylglycine-generating enzyme required for sulfatase activity
MLKNWLFIINGIIGISLISLLSCRALPTNPADDPGNVTLNLFVKAGSSTVQEQIISIGIVINIPKLVQKIDVRFGENDSGNISIPYSNSATTYDTIYTSGKFLTASKKTILVTATLSDGLFKSAELPVEITEKLLTIHLDTLPVSHPIIVNKPDTLKFNASTDPIDAAIVYTISSTPTLDSNSLKLIVNGSNAFAILTAPQAGKYQIKFLAKSGKVRDSSIVELTAYNKPIFSSVPMDDTLNMGESDTLLFVPVQDSTNPVSIYFLNKNDFLAGTINTSNSTPESLKIIFTPTEIKNYTFIVALIGKYSTDTVQIKRFVKSPVSVLWKQPSIDINAVEGALVQETFRKYLTNNTLAGINFTTDKGTLVDSIWKWSLPWGGSSIDTVVITARQADVVSPFKMIIHVVSGDSTPPEIRRSIPALEISTVSSSQFACKFLVADKGAGIGKVLFALDNTVLIDTSHSDSVYQCIVKGLKQGVKTALKIKVTDASIKQNSDSLTVYLTYDSTMQDNDAPVIVQKSGLQSGNRVISQTGTLVFNVTDQNGISNVYCKLNGTAITAISNTAGDYSVSYTLTTPGHNRLVIYAVDNSSNKNIDSSVVKLDYNQVPQIILKSPVNGISAISKSVNFNWSGSDRELDSLKYGLYLGLNATNLDIIYNGSDTNFTYDLSSGKEYFWKVRVTDGPDTFVESSIRSFKTNNLPAITLSSPLNSTSSMAIPVALSWTATDADVEDAGALTYELYLDTNQNPVTKIASPAALSFDVSALTFGCKYYWKIVASDGKDKATTPIWTFTTGNPAKITSQPLDDTLNLPGGSVIFTVAADGYGKSINYKWLKNGGIVNGEVTNSLALQSGVHGDIYRCVADNGIGKPDTSTPVTLKIAYRVSTLSTGNGTGAISPSNPYVLQGGSQVFTFTPNQKTIISKLFKGTTQIPVNSACTLSSVVAPDSVKVMFYAVPALLKAIPSKGAEFTMGSTSPLYSPDIAHQVKFTYGFYMDSTEVTQNEYKGLLNLEPWGNTVGAQYPATACNWDDVILFCNERSKQDGLDTVYSYSSKTFSGVHFEITNLKISYEKIGYRLPNEAEWEFAYRGGTTTDYYWNKNIDTTNSDSTVISLYAWWSYNESESYQVSPVAQKLPNNYRLYDMAGNAFEFCNEIYDRENRMSNLTQVDPIATTICNYDYCWHVAKGGYYGCSYYELTAWWRGQNSMQGDDATVGFRCVLQTERMLSR